MKNLSAQAAKALRARAARVRIDGGAQAAFERLMRRQRTVGAAMTLVRAGQIERTLTFGMARLHPRTPVTRETVFRCASVSKLVMAMAALRLCEEGILALDADVSECFGFAVRNPAFPHAPITLRMLLTHTAGLCDAGDYARGDAPLSRLLVRAENYLPHAPGARFAYSNLGAGVAGCLMERAAGERFEALVAHLIFAPLGIAASFAPQWIPDASRIADGHRVRVPLPPHVVYPAQKIAQRPLPPMDIERDYFIAPGRMLATSEELARLLTLLLSPDGMGILSPERLAQLRTCQDGHGGVQSAGRGLNVAFLDDVYRPGRLVGHQGVAYGMCCECFGDPVTGDGVVFQTSGSWLSKGGSLMHVGADALALGFALLGEET